MFEKNGKHQVVAIMAHLGKYYLLFWNESVKIVVSINMIFLFTVVVGTLCIHLVAAYSRFIKGIDPKV
ncbi:hypothetical protein PWEIH_13954 [Listeria weihenstephanensis FSL R9-0317]|nr:hypothetical protein PWEIH_13954 [Listeria weihenstephanensis FSL R9-0317]